MGLKQNSAKKNSTAKKQTSVATARASRVSAVTAVTAETAATTLNNDDNNTNDEMTQLKHSSVPIKISKSPVKKGGKFSSSLWTKSKKRRFIGPKTSRQHSAAIHKLQAKRRMQRQLLLGLILLLHCTERPELSVQYWQKKLQQLQHLENATSIHSSDPSSTNNIWKKAHSKVQSILKDHKSKNDAMENGGDNDSLVSKYLEALNEYVASLTTTSSSSSSPPSAITAIQTHAEWLRQRWDQWQQMSLQVATQLSEESKYWTNATLIYLWESNPRARLLTNKYNTLRQQVQDSTKAVISIPLQAVDVLTSLLVRTTQACYEMLPNRSTQEATTAPSALLESRILTSSTSHHGKEWTFLPNASSSFSSSSSIEFPNQMEHFKESSQTAWKAAKDHSQKVLSSLQDHHQQGSSDSSGRKMSDPQQPQQQPQQQHFHLRATKINMAQEASQEDTTTSSTHRTNPFSKAATAVTDMLPPIRTPQRRSSQVIIQDWVQRIQQGTVANHYSSSNSDRSSSGANSND